MVLFYALAAFKVWMLVDAIRRHIDQHWFYIIALLPLGDWAYFFMYKWPELRGVALGTRRHRAASLQDLAYAAQTSPSAENRLRLAEKLFDTGLHAEAKLQFSGVLKAYPNDLRALYGLALTLKAEGDLAEAATQLERLLEISPGHDEYAAALELADTHKLRHQPDAALRVLEFLVKKSPRLKHQLALAEHLVDMGRKPEAQTLLESALLDYEHAPAFVRKRERSYANSARSLRTHLDT